MDRSLMLKGFWMKAWQPFSRMAFACSFLLYPLDRITRTSSSIFRRLS